MPRPPGSSGSSPGPWGWPPTASRSRRRRCRNASSPQNCPRSRGSTAADASIERVTQHVTSSERDPGPSGAAFATVTRSYYPTIIAIFAPLLLISNICATKGVEFGPIIGEWSIITDGGFFLFPVAYVLGDVLSEVYGFRAARRGIYLGFGVAALGALAFWVTSILPGADFYENQESFDTVTQAFFQVLAASLAGYLVGQTLNAFVLVRIKEYTRERHLWAR